MIDLRNFFFRMLDRAFSVCDFGQLICDRTLLDEFEQRSIQIYNQNPVKITMCPRVKSP